MSVASRIIQLSTTISQNTERFDKWLRDNNRAQPSFAADGPLFDDPFPPEVESARILIQDASLELSELVQGPRAVLMTALSSSRTDLETVYRNDIVHKIPLDNLNGTTYTELASQTGISEVALTRILQNAIANRVFSEPAPGRIAHSVSSKLWATDELMNQWAGMATQDGFHVLKFLGQALTKFPAADDPAETGASIYHGAVEGKLDTFYNMLAKDPKRAERFGAGMSLFQKGDGYALRHLVDGYDWMALPEGSTVVDIGGSHGDTAIAVTKKFPHLRFVVQDLENTIQTAPEIPEHLPVELSVHNFFEPQPIKGAKVYLLRWILHNWSDKFGLRILEALKPALENGSRILIMDAVVPPLGVLPNAIEREIRFMDNMMLALFNAGDRTAERWEGLLKTSDARFDYRGIKTIEGSTLSLIEAVWRP
jgi:hypothetical protein